MRFGARPAGSARAGTPVGSIAARFLVVAVLGVAASAGTLARPASVAAHALLRSSTPAVGATLATAPAAVTLTFGEEPDLRLTSITVLDTSGTNHASGPVAAVPDPPATVAVPLGPLRDGVYTVSWRTVSSVDGHIAAGSFVFGVGVAPPSGPPDSEAGGTGQVGSPPALVTRWLLYLGLIALIGAAFVAVAVATPAGARGARDLLAMAAVGWSLTALGSLGVAGVQWLETGASLETILATSVGTAAIVRIVVLGAIAVAVAALASVPRLAGRAGWAFVGVTAGAAVVADVALGHAAAGKGWLLQVAAQSLHGLAAGAWVGGVAALLLLLRTTPAGDRLATARRFSTWAGVVLVLVAATGAVRALQEVGTLDALLNTDFGRVVLAKTALLLALAGLGALSRFVNLRSAVAFANRFRRIASAEVVVAVAVLGCSALLVNLTPPTSAGVLQEPTPPILARGSDFGTSVKARLIASPGMAGENQFDLTLIDFDTSAPVDASAAELRFELRSQPDVAPSTLELERTEAGRFAATGANLSIDGIWQVTATVTVAGGAVEIQMLAVTSIAPQQVERLVTPGLPTLHTIQLGALGSAQVYLDPGHAGSNELHVTYFNPAGGELPVQSAVIAAVQGEGVTQLPAVRQLDTGHFVATVDTLDGPLAVDVISPAPAGSAEGQLHLHLVIEVTP